MKKYREPDRDLEKKHDVFNGNYEKLIAYEHHQDSSICHEDILNILNLSARKQFVKN